MSRKFDADIEALKKEYEKKLKDLLDALENEKKAHSLTREKYAELQNSFGIIGQ